MRDETIEQKRARESREFLERNAHVLRRIHWERKAEADLAAHRHQQGYSL